MEILLLTAALGYNTGVSWHCPVITTLYRSCLACICNERGTVGHIPSLYPEVHPEQRNSSPHPREPLIPHAWVLHCLPVYPADAASEESQTTPSSSGGITRALTGTMKTSTPCCNETHDRVFAGQSLSRCRSPHLYLPTQHHLPPQKTSSSAHCPSPSFSHPPSHHSPVSDGPSRQTDLLLALCLPLGDGNLVLHCHWLLL